MGLFKHKISTNNLVKLLSKIADKFAMRENIHIMVSHHYMNISNTDLFTKFERAVASLKFCQKLNFMIQELKLLGVEFCLISHGWVG